MVAEVALFDLTNSAMVECLDSLNRITCQAVVGLIGSNDSPGPLHLLRNFLRTLKVTTI